MVKNFIFVNLMLIAFVLAVSNVSAEIIISQTQQIYSLGDDFKVDLNVGTIEPGYLDLTLVCNSANINLYHDVPASESVTIKRKLIPLYIGAAFGSCHLSSIYGLNSKESGNFQISSDADVELNLDNYTVMAGETIVIKGKSRMANGNNLGSNQNAFVEVKLNDISSSSTIKNGEFSVTLTVPPTLRKGDYNLQVKVYDTDSDNTVLNHGETTITLRVNQVPSELEIALDKSSIKPGENVSIIPFLHDRAGELYNQDLLIEIIDPANNIIFQGVTAANQEFIFKTNTTYSPGETTIIVQKNNMTSTKSIDVEELRLLAVKILNGTMTITNTGNVPYSGIVEIGIDSEKVLKEINLAIGESKEYLVSAPNGEHQVSLKDDQNQFYNRGVQLTGNAIAINEKVSNLFANYPIIWIFIIAVILASVYAMYRKNKYGKVFFLPDHQRIPYKGMEFKMRHRKNEDIGIEIASPKTISVGSMMQNKRQENEKINIRGDIRNAEPSSDIHGQKQPVVVVALKIKNELVGIANENVKKALEYAYQKKAVTSSSGNSVIAILSPLLTKTFKNEEIAVKIAQDIEGVLKEHNRRFKDKIVFGIGINSGELINKVEDNMLKFTSIEKTIPLAKKIAELSDGEVLLSSTVHTRTMNTVKAEKNVNTGNIDTFRIKRVVDNEEAKKFIEKFNRRN